MQHGDNTMAARSSDGSRFASKSKCCRIAKDLKVRADTTEKEALRKKNMIYFLRWDKL